MKFRRFRLNPATSTGPAPVTAPTLPHAATVPSAPGEHIYLPTTPEKLRAHAERCLGQIADAQTQIDELQDWIAHWRAEHADFLRTAQLVERDRVASVLDATPQPGPAMGRDQLLNGWQPGLEGPGEPHPDEGGPSTYLRPSQDGDTERLPRIAAEVAR